MNYLLKLGHRHISFIYGVQEEIQDLDRLQAFRQAFEEVNAEFNERWIYRCGPSLDEGYQAAFTLLQQTERPTALVAVNDLQGMAVIRAATDLGLNVSKDVSIASFDNIPFASFCVPKLTTVAGEPEKNGRDAVKLLLKRLKDPKGQAQIITSGWELIVRESTGAAPRLNAHVDRHVLEVVGGDNELT